MEHNDTIWIKNSEHVIQQQHEGDCQMSYDTCHRKGKIDVRLDRNNTTINTPLTKKSTPWDEGD